VGGSEVTENANWCVNRRRSLAIPIPFSSPSLASSDPIRASGARKRVDEEKDAEKDLHPPNASLTRGHIVLA
jgi:hypothetical protein